MAQADGPLRSVHSLSVHHQSTLKGSHTTKSVPLTLDWNRSQVKQVVQELKRKPLSLMVGHQESGKSTFTRQICHLLAVGEDRSVILWWDLLNHDHSRVQSWEQLATLPQAVASPFLDHRNVVKELQSNGGKNIVLVVDHLTQSSKFLRQLLSKSVLPQCSIILILQYSYVETVVGDIADYDLFEMKGIEPGNVHELVRKKAQELKLKGIDRVADHIRANPELQDMCRDPALNLEVLKIYKDNNHQYPKTITALLNAIVDNRVAKYKPQNADDNEIKDHLHCIYRLAYETQKHDTFSRYEFSCLCATIGIPGPGPQIGLGLVQIFTQKEQVCCKFVHKTIQAYLAAMYVRSKPVYDQAYLALDFTSEIMGEEKYQMMLTYYCGIAHTRGQASTLNVEKITLYPLLECIAETLSLDEHVDSKKFLILFLNCLYEAQDQSLTRKFLSRRQHALVIPLESNLAESKLEMLSYCVAHSGISNWKVETTSEHFYMDYFKMLVTDKLSMETKSNFELLVIEGVTNQLFPVHPKQIQSSKSKSNVYSRTTRELFHRLLQLYSPIKLKSDGSNASYISILACQCLQNEMETQELLTLEPIIANHWLPMKPKSGKKAPNQQEENPQTLLHMQTHHSSQHIEFVVMMAPLPQRIKFLMPQTREEIIIELCTNGSPDFLAGGIEDHLGLISAQSFFQETGFSSSSEEMIVPRLPLPDQSQSRALILAPSLTDASQRHGAQQSYGNQLATLVPDIAHASVTSTERRQGQIPVQGHQQNLSMNGSPFNNTFERSVKQFQSQKQPIMKPGTVFHTTIPEIFGADQTYPLPDESNLIRKGGNGEIFLGVFDTREFAIKKTSYRNREYLIHSKLRHRNIIPLLCLMMGEKQHSQRRKWFCYHFLPRATGDLARLAVDKEENTLKQLRLKYGDNPRKFGLVQGNLKYLLTQILRGLVYLHGLNIVHRDLKASNILLTFHCSCYNPMICTCTNKCDVQLADFDSAVQLNEDGALPASQVSKTDPNLKTFTIVPVGTNGYRPPESSQLIISNDIRCITPGVSTKSDIWSFGVLMMRMLNGAYGPASQREVSSVVINL
jgi:hypothetical protein